jgi:hypothetical protein
MNFVNFILYLLLVEFLYLLLRLSNTNPTKNWVWTQVLRKGKQFLLHCYYKMTGTSCHIYTTILYNKCQMAQCCKWNTYLYPIVNLFKYHSFLYDECRTRLILTVKTCIFITGLSLKKEKEKKVTKPFEHTCRFRWEYKSELSIISCLFIAQINSMWLLDCVMMNVDVLLIVPLLQSNTLCYIAQSMLLFNVN